MLRTKRIDVGLRHIRRLFFGFRHALSFFRERLRADYSQTVAHDEEARGRSAARRNHPSTRGGVGRIWPDALASRHSAAALFGSWATLFKRHLRRVISQLLAGGP
jgi:hypothetical protein